MMSIVGISAVNAIHSVLHAIHQVSRIAQHARYIKVWNSFFKLRVLLLRQLHLLLLQLGIVQRVA